MQLQGPIELLETAIDSVDVQGLSFEEAERLVQAKRRLDLVCSRALAHLDDVSAARFAGTSISEIRAGRVRERKVARIPDIAEAVNEGLLSPRQGEVLADNSELASDLFSLAPGKTPDELKAEAARMRRSSGESEAERYRRLCSKQSMRSWTDGDGLVNLHAKVPPEDAAPVLSRLRSILRTMRGRPGASTEALRADAFLALLSGNVGGQKQTVVNVHVDLESLRRGWAEGDGFCEVAGLGWLPVGRVQNCFEEAVLRVLVTSKNRLVWSADSSKPLPQPIKDAITAHNRHRCVRCGAQATEVDHRVPRFKGGSHDVDNLQSLCDACHGGKTVDEAPWSATHYRDRWPRAG